MNKMRDSHQLYKKYKNKPTEQSLYDFFIAALREYISHVTGRDNIRINDLGIKTREDFDSWVRNDNKLLEWLKREFGVRLVITGNDFVIIDA